LDAVVNGCGNQRRVPPTSAGTCWFVRCTLLSHKRPLLSSAAHRACAVDPRGPQRGVIRAWVGTSDQPVFGIRDAHPLRVPETCPPQRAKALECQRPFRRCPIPIGFHCVRRGKIIVGRTFAITVQIDERRETWCLTVVRTDPLRVVRRSMRGTFFPVAVGIVVVVQSTTTNAEHFCAIRVIRSAICSVPFVSPQVILQIYKTTLAR